MQQYYIHTYVCYYVTEMIIKFLPLLTEGNTDIGGSIRFGKLSLSQGSMYLELPLNIVLTTQFLFQYMPNIPSVLTILRKAIFREICKRYFYILIYCCVLVLHLLDFMKNINAFLPSLIFCYVYNFLSRKLEKALNFLFFSHKYKK